MKYRITTIIIIGYQCSSLPPFTGQRCIKINSMTFGKVFGTLHEKILRLFKSFVGKIKSGIIEYNAHHPWP